MTSTRRPTPCLTVARWGAIDLSHNNEAPHEGATAEARDIPAGVRRRLGPFERAVVQAVLGLTNPNETAKVVLGSRYGNLASAASILNALAGGESPSPTLFSHSVLNAGCGVANQVRKDRSSHTAVAAGAHTLHGTLTEAWLHSAENEDEDAAHIVVLADAPFPPTYEALKTPWLANICIGLRVERCDKHVSVTSTSLGTQGYRTLLTALRSGQQTLVSEMGLWGTAC